MYALILILFQLYLQVVSSIRFYANRIHRRTLNGLYHHNRTPELIYEDAHKLGKLPRHVACLLRLKPREMEGGGVEGLVSEAAELVTWCVCMGIRRLTLHDRGAVLRKQTRNGKLQSRVQWNLQRYFGSAGPPVIEYEVPPLQDEREVENTQQKEGLRNRGGGGSSATGDETAVKRSPDLVVSVVSEYQGKALLVDLARSYAEVGIQASRISERMIDRDLAKVGIKEPDLIMTFGPRIELEGLQPWCLRLAEIFGIQDNEFEVSYAIFCRGLERYAGSKANRGR